MKRLLLIIGTTLMLFIIWISNRDNVIITTDKNSYNRSEVSENGIKMEPMFKHKYGDDGGENLVYHWKTTEGEFIRKGKEVRNQDESLMVWNAKEDVKSTDIDLEVIGSESKKVLATTKLTITLNNGSYEVKN